MAVLQQPLATARPVPPGKRHAAAAALRTPLGLSAAIAVAVLLALTVLGPLLWGAAAATTAVTDRLEPPSAAHLLGTDELGRDVLARVLAATGPSVGLALAATGICVGGGLVLGLVPTVLTGRARRAFIGTIEVLMAFPWLLLALFFSVIWGTGAAGAVLAVGCAGAPTFARLTYTLAASVSGRAFVQAATVLGVGRIRRLARHVVPNIAEPLIINAAVVAGSSLLAFAALSFLGLGVRPPDYDWGRLLGDGISHVYVTPTTALAPGVAVVLAGLAFNLLGEALAAAAGLRIVRRVALPRRVPAPAGRKEPGAAAEPSAVLDVADLRVSFGDAQPVRGVSLRVAPGEVVGIVGESGSGKSLTALACAGLVDPAGRVAAERLDLLGADLRHPPDRATRSMLGTSLAMIFQDPMTSLNPALRVGTQLAEVAEVHEGTPRRAAWRRAVDRLGAVRIDHPELRAAQFPHQLSGGMRQRAMIAMGLMGTPRLIIADEPTTALDVTVQRQVLALLQAAKTRTGAAILLISHDIAVVAGFCDRVLVMRGGEIVEEIAAADLLTGARHPYTRALLACVPDLGTDRDRPLATVGEV